MNHVAKRIGGLLTILTATDDPSVITKIFAHLGLSTRAPAPIPIPDTALLFVSGLLGLVGHRWLQGRREGTQVG